jgi:hypothetical protein
MHVTPFNPDLPLPAAENTTLTAAEKVISSQ